MIFFGICYSVYATPFQTRETILPLHTMLILYHKNT